LTLDSLRETGVDLVARILAGLDASQPLELRRRLLARGLIDRLTRSVIAESRRRLAASAVASPADVRAHREPLVSLGPGEATDLQALNDFLLRQVYHHPAVLVMVAKGQAVLRELFRRFTADPRFLPRSTQARIAAASDHPARIIGDYLAGMTDRHAILIYQRLVDPGTPVGTGLGE
jgi:dGTPase